VLSSLIRKFKLEHYDPDFVADLVVDDLPRNLSGADFSAIASGALVNSLKRLCESMDRRVTPLRSLDTVLDEWGDLTPVVTAKDLVDASRLVVPSVTQEDLRRYQRLREDFSSNVPVRVPEQQPSQRLLPPLRVKYPPPPPPVGLALALSVPPVAQERQQTPVLQRQGSSSVGSAETSNSPPRRSIFGGSHKK
jgi:hypothetical protein